MAYNPAYPEQGSYQYAQGQQLPPSQGQYPPPQGQSQPTTALFQQPGNGQYQSIQGHYQQQPQFQQPPAVGQQAQPQYQDAFGNKQPYPPAGPPHNVQTLGESKGPWNPSQATAYSGPDIAGEDADENAAEEQLSASAPSYDVVISGYESVGSDAPIGPPPSYESSTEVAPATVDSARMPAMSAEVAREALLESADRHTCWGKGAARDMEIKDIQATCAYHYVLESFTEGRSTHHTHTPYKGGYVDGPHNGPAPLPWDVPCSATALFKTEQHKIPVPHTEVVRPCHLCWGRGFNRCTRCRGRGRVRCGFCHGNGHRHVTRDGRSHRERCSACHGHGRKHCHTCHGSGCVLCITCSGYGSVKQFIQLTVSFTNRQNDHIIEKSDLPDELIRNVEGDTIFEQTLPRVGAIENFFEQEINQKSRELVHMHSKSWLSEHIIQQRHYLRAVPVHECHFQYNEKIGRFWVYGHNKEVYTTEYPHTCCCCRCTIL